MQVTGRSRLFAREGLPTPPRPRRLPANGESPVASAPHGQGRRHRCGHDRRPRPGGRRARPGGRRRLPGADPVLPPAGLGRARPRRDLGLRPGHRWPRSGAASPRRARPWRPSASPTSARPWWRSTARPGGPCTGPSSGRTAGPRRCARRSPTAGHLPLVRATTGLVLDPYFSATKVAWLLREGDLPLAASDPGLSFCTVDTWVLWNLTGGPAGGVLRHRSLQRQPHPPARYVHARLVRRVVRPLRRARAHAARGAPVGRPLRAPPRWWTSAPRPPPSTVSRSRACSATSRRRSSARPASSRAWSRSPTAPAASLWPTWAPDARPRRTVSRSAAPGISARTRRLRTPASLTRSRARRSCPARPSSGCATGSASSPRPRRSGLWRRRSPTAAASRSCRPSPVSAARGGTRRRAASSPA